MSHVEVVEKACVFCGLKSHRADWADQPHPACDSHSAEEVAMARASQAPQADPFAPPPAPPASQPS
jgi:hypothetical protein